MTVIESINQWLLDLLSETNFSPQITNILHLGILLFGILIFVAIITAFSRYILIRIINQWISKDGTRLYHFMFKNRFFWAITQLIPFLIVANSLPVVLDQFPNWISPVERVIEIYGVILTLWILRSFLRSIRDYASTKESLRDKPLDSYLQVIMIILYMMGGLLTFSLLTGKSLWTFITTLGAASAILMLIFKDTILGFVASIQVAVNDMVRIGDWIQMDKYGADGAVIEINLNTVKVQNWNKTITTIPTYFLISDSFINWRGMQESGGRRIKRPIYIKISSIRYMTDEEVEDLKKIQLLADYIETRQAEIKKYNEETGADPHTPVNGRNLTNVGLFRKYIQLYADQRPDIRKDMSFMVRHLSPTAHGLPIELYFFTDTVAWVEYEGIMSDIFDHIFAAVKYFDLEVFESPASDDIRFLTGRPQEV